MLIERQSVVAAPAEQVWQRVVTPEGINDELRPWMTMSVPRGAKGITVDTVPIGAPIGRAWLRLFGVFVKGHGELPSGGHENCPLAPPAGTYMAITGQSDVAADMCCHSTMTGSASPSSSRDGGFARIRRC
ncbi:hypothetical protein [Mycobacterium canetti]|uniref:hypothetical protein n=1 Tax=Mycobacterium canetti TaxID=78331 RepID=UPI001E50C087|nr:hypothetical protein [Mycobacterium canetti]